MLKVWGKKLLQEVDVVKPIYLVIFGFSMRGSEGLKFLFQTG